MIERLDYLNALLPFFNTPVIKILVGVRRSGKSTILDMLEEELLRRGVYKENIYHKVFTSMDFANGYDCTAMYKDIRSAVIGKGKCYLLLDELQEVDGWERVVNSLLENKELDVDIYVTGSNSKLMSSEISTYLTGRYVQIPVYTLSFSEYKIFKANSGLSDKDLLNEYIKFGGFPFLAMGNFTQSSAYQVVEGIYSAIVRGDIARRHKIANQELFDRVVKFIIDNVGKTFSANSIVKFLKGEQRSISVEVIYNYILWLKEAFIVYECNRYDLQGKEVMKTQEKYYLSDIAFRYALSSYDGKMVAAMLENIVFLELKKRGYAVHIGKFNTKEIDFVAEKQGERIYIQVCRNIPDDDEGRDREIGTLLKIKDHYRKYVVTMDELAVGNDNGVKIMHLADFLTTNEY